MHTTLHRAQVGAPGGHALVVFFEAPQWDSAAYERIESLLAKAWGVSIHDLDVHNVRTEREQCGSWAVGSADTGDLRLFEVGGGTLGPIYAAPQSLMFLVLPSTLARLQGALIRLVQQLAKGGGNHG